MTAKEFEKFYLEMLKARKAFVVERGNKKRSKAIEDDLLLFYDEMANIISSLQKENGELRKIIWIRHAKNCGGVPALYGDDGEMQCGRCMVDFKRDPIDKLAPILKSV